MVDQLTDTLRWWASLGAFLGIWPMGALLVRFARNRDADQFEVTARVLLGGALMACLLAILLAGAIIPFANDARLADFDTSHPIYRGGMAAAWLFWGCCAWAVPVVFFDTRKMLAGSVLFWWAAYFASGMTVGALL